MEDWSRGISLRKKRSVKPKISAPRQISSPVVTPLASTAERPRLPEKKSSDRSQSRENTADYVKRRYSTKLNQLPKDYFDAPAVPALPNQYAQPPPRDARRVEGPRGEKPAVDLKALQDPDLRSEQYVAHILAHASEQDIRDYQQELIRVKHRTSTDIQHNVYQNRSQFIKISQEAEKLKTEMRTLRGLMSDLTNTLGQTNAALGITTGTPTTRKYANRSSVANLEALWSSHLQELWRRVEGSQKYLPAIPGRHVVHESGRWVELNTATWKPRRRVHLILLNDHLLVATEKKRVDQSTTSENGKPKSSTPHSQLMADRCWPLQDVEVADLSVRPGSESGGRKSSKSKTLNAINVRVELDSFTYAVPEGDSPEKAALLAKIRKEIANLRRAAQAETEDRLTSRSTSRPLSSHTRDTTRNSTQTNGTAAPDPAASKASALVDVDGRQQTFRSVEMQVDELDIDIALQRFDESVECVERLRKIALANRGNAAVQELVDGRVQERAARLARELMRQLVDTSSFLGATQQHVAWLSKLGFEARASDAYLEARSGVIETRTGQCADQGDLHQYLYELSFIYFTLIRNTVSIYAACFAPAMTSAAVKWAKGHVERFNEMLRLQLRKLDPAGEERRVCLERAREHAGLLAEVGVDFRGMVGKGLVGEGG